MAFSGGEDYYCRQFLPNPFDPSRCGTCLRPSHMHLNSTPALTSQENCDFLSSVTSSDVIQNGRNCLVNPLSLEWDLSLEDTDSLWSSQDQDDWPERSESSSPEGCCDASWMEENRGRARSRRPSEARGDRERESGYFSPDRKGVGSSHREDAPPQRPFRYYERGHPLPSNHSPEPKACVPYRNRNLGIPSQRRDAETFNQETWRSESPQRYVNRSNFRRGTDSRGQGSPSSPSPDRSPSPNRYKQAECPGSSPRRRSSQSRSRAPSQAPSHAPSRHPSGMSSPLHRRGSVVSGPASPAWHTPVHKHEESPPVWSNGTDSFQRGRVRESRQPSHTSNGHSLDSEKLYRNLDSISRRGSSGLQPDGHEGSYSPRPRRNTNSSTNTRSRNSRDCSPPRSVYGTRHHSPQREKPYVRDTRPDTEHRYSKRASEGFGGNDSSPAAQSPWHGSSHSLPSPAPSRSSSPSRRALDAQQLTRSLTTHATAMDADSRGGDRSKSNTRRGLDVLLTSEPKRNPVETEDVGMTIEDYIILADIPRTIMESEEETQVLRRRAQSPSPRRLEPNRVPRYDDETDGCSLEADTDERGRGRERGRNRREREREKFRESQDGRCSQKQSTTDQHFTKSSNISTLKAQRSSKPQDKVLPENTQRPPDLLTLKGWMSRLDENRKWRKHWFVFGDSVLRFFRDSDAEESDDPDGEIDLTSCLNVQDCDVEKNYGFQIQTKRAVFTLSALTSRMRRSWVDVLRQAIQSYHSSSITDQSERSSGKENSSPRHSSSCQQSSRLTCETGPESAEQHATTQRQTDHRSDSSDQDPDATPSNLALVSQREEGEGWDREQAKRLEERNKWFESGLSFSEMSSRWDSMELKKGSVPIPVSQMDPEVIKKWAEFESLSFGDVSTQSLIGAQRSPSTQALHREALSLREQVEGLRRERVAMRTVVEVEVGVEEVVEDSPCGPGAPCRARMKAMEEAHRRSLRELQERHAREIRELERERDRLLEEETQAAAQAVEALKKAHREELEREVEKARRLGGGVSNFQSSCAGQRSREDSLHNELDVLSESYSQKCLELSRTEQSCGDKQTDLGWRDREMDQLRRENQELKARLAEEVSRMRCFLTGQRSGFVSPSICDRSPSELEMELRAKDNEIQYLQKEISCLQSEALSLTKEKEAAYDRYKEAYVELSGMKGRSQLEMGSLREHLRLANAALQEGARDG